MATKKARYIPITRTQAVEFLKAIKGATFVTLQMESEPSWKGKKADNPHIGKVTKVSVFNGMLNYDYGANVNRALVKAGQAPTFVPQPPPWGTRIGDTCIIDHKGQAYLDVRCLKALKVKYIDENGKKIDKATIAAFLKPSSPPTQGVMVRRLLMAHIQKLHLKGCRYSLRA